MIGARACLIVAGACALLTAPSCMVFQDAVTENVGQVYGRKSGLLTVEGQVASCGEFGEARVDDPPVLDKPYPLTDEPTSYLIFQKNAHGSVEARAVDEDGEELWIGDFVGYIGKRRSTAWGLSLGSRTTGDAETPAD